MEYTNRIQEVRSRLGALDVSLSVERTPYIKSQLTSARHSLDDAESALRHAAADHSNAAMWYGFADLQIQYAVQIVEKVHEVVDTYGGSENLTEFG